MKLADLYVEFRAKGLARLRHGLDRLHTNLRGVARTGRRAFMAISGAIGGSIYAFVRFEKQMAMVSTMLSEADMKWMRPFAEGVRRMSREFGESTATLSKGLYDILSASIAPTKALDVLTVAVKAAAGGMTSTAIAADAITTILNSYRLPASKAAEISDKLFMTVRKGKLTFEQLASSIGKAAATAAVSGLKLEELLAAISTVTRAGINADQAMTAVVGVLRSFLKPTDEAKKLAKELGFEMNTATLKSKGLVGVFQKINHLSAEQVAVLFPNIRGLKGVAAALQDLQGYQQDLELQYRSTGAAQEAFAKATDTVGFALGKLKERFKDLGREIGKSFKPEIETATSILDSLLKKMEEVGGSRLKTGLKVGGVLAGIAAAAPALGRAGKFLYSGGRWKGGLAAAYLAAMAYAGKELGLKLAKTIGGGVLPRERYKEEAEAAKKAGEAYEKYLRKPWDDLVSAIAKAQVFLEKYRETAARKIPTKELYEFAEAIERIGESRVLAHPLFDVIIGGAAKEEATKAIALIRESWGTERAMFEWRKRKAAEANREIMEAYRVSMKDLERRREKQKQVVTEFRGMLKEAGEELTDAFGGGTKWQRAYRSASRHVESLYKRLEKFAKEHGLLGMLTKWKQRELARAYRNIYSQMKKEGDQARQEMEAAEARRRIGMEEYIVEAKYGRKAGALFRLINQIKEAKKAGPLSSLQREYFQTQLEEIQKVGRPKAGRWTGLEGFWRQLQSAAMTRQTKDQAKKVTSLVGEAVKSLKSIDKKTGQPVVVE